MNWLAGFLLSTVSTQGPKMPIYEHYGKLHFEPGIHEENATDSDRRSVTTGLGDDWCPHDVRDRYSCSPK